MYTKSLMFPLVESPFLLVKFQFVMANSSILLTCSWWLDQHFSGKIPIFVGEIAISFTDVPPKTGLSRHCSRVAVEFVGLPRLAPSTLPGVSAGFSVFSHGENMETWVYPSSPHIIRGFTQIMSVLPSDIRMDTVNKSNFWPWEIPMWGCIKLFLPARILSSLNSPLFCRNGHSMSW